MLLTPFSCTQRPSALVCSGFCNKILQPGWFVNNRTSVLTVLEAGRPRTGCQHGQSLVTALFWAAVFSLCPPMVEEARELCGVSLVRALIPFRKAAPSWPNHIPEVPPPTTITLVINISTCKFRGGDTTIQPISVSVLLTYCWVTNYHEPGDLKKHTFTISSVFGSGVWTWLNWASLTPA